jgi:4-alpha-glucanotransferase
VLLRDKSVKQKRGILLPLFSLPSPHGIGSLGEEAYRFIDFLRETNQSYWQILPLCPVGKGNSPYTSLCSFAGEILYIDLNILVDEKLLENKEIPAKDFPENVDYEVVRGFKIPLLRLASSRFNTKDAEYRDFCKENEYWLKGFADFMFKREHYEKEFYYITQFLFFKQYNRLHNYANVSDIKIIGDIPFYVAPHSSDVADNPQIFELDEDMKTTLVAGVPPDIFSIDGQLWGNPIYNWDHLEKNDFKWWKQRIIHNLKLYDVLRIDHFRAFADYYCIPADDKNAKSGYWKKGIGDKFWKSLKKDIGALPIIAEDLGGEDSPLVTELLNQTGFPNMKVLQFAFNKDLSNPFLPENFDRPCVCYTGTHDNDTTLGWYEHLSEKEKALFFKTVPQKNTSPVLNLISFAIDSKAETVIIPLQDYMQLNSSARINTPGVPTGNWVWRFRKKDITNQLKDLIKKI